MDRFKEKLLKTIRLCNEELANRKNGMVSESTEEQLENIILPELTQLLEKINNNQCPAKEKVMLAFYFYPFLKNQKVIEYTRTDLMDTDKVGELFNYCQILEAYITKSGWDFLINYYGYDGLYDIDKKSGWFDAENLEEFKLCIDGQIESCIQGGLA